MILSKVIQYTRLLGQFQASLFFFYEKSLSVKKHQNAKQTTLTLLEVFVCAKTYSLCYFLFVFFLLVGFGLIYVFVRSKSIPQNKMAWNCLNNLICYTTDLYPYQPIYREFICTHLFLFVLKRIFLNLFHLWESLLVYDHLCECLYENKQVF